MSNFILLRMSFHIDNFAMQILDQALVVSKSMYISAFILVFKFGTTFCSPLIAVKRIIAIHTAKVIDVSPACRCPIPHNSLRLVSVRSKIAGESRESERSDCK